MTNSPPTAATSLEASEARFRAALSAGRMGSWETDHTTRKRYWSKEGMDLFGIELVDGIGTVGGPNDEYVAAIHPDDRHQVQRFQELSARQDSFPAEYRIVKPDGSTLWLSGRGMVVLRGLDGTPLRLISIMADATERKLAEEQLRDADRRKDIFIAVLAHELRNPLAPIRNAIGVLRKLGTSSPKADWCHDVIDRQVTQMTRLLDDLLDVARLSRGALRLRTASLNLADVLDHALEIARPFIDAGKHSLVVRPLAETYEIEADLTRLAQVFSNILINAAKYTPQGGSIELHVASENDRVVVTIADSGIGIAPENLEKVFELFGQLETTKDTAQGGQGIGLSLAKDLVEMHGGTISALSGGEGKGSSFEVRLPVLNIAKAVEPTEAGPNPTKEVDAPANTYRVLIADDSKDAAETYALLLQEMGHRVDIAHDGEEALRLAESLRPEVVLLDLGMPKIDGLEVCRKIRAAPWGRTMLLIAQTGWGQEDDRRRTREAGFDHHLVKPIELAVIESLIATLG